MSMIFPTRKRDRFDLVSGLFVPKPLRFAGYPCCCGCECECEHGLNGTVKCCLHVTIDYMAGSGGGCTEGECLDYNTTHTLYRSSNCVWKCEYVSQDCDTAEITATLYRDGTDYKLKVELGGHVWEEDFGETKPDLCEGGPFELDHQADSGSCDSSSATCSVAAVAGDVPCGCGPPCVPCADGKGPPCYTATLDLTGTGLAYLDCPSANTARLANTGPCSWSGKRMGPPDCYEVNGLSCTVTINLAVSEGMARINYPSGSGNYFSLVSADPIDCLSPMTLTAEQGDPGGSITLTPAGECASQPSYGGTACNCLCHDVPESVLITIGGASCPVSGTIALEFDDTVFGINSIAWSYIFPDNAGYVFAQLDHRAALPTGTCKLFVKARSTSPYGNVMWLHNVTGTQYDCTQLANYECTWIYNDHGCGGSEDSTATFL